MPYPLTETGKLARQYGLSYATARYRLANNIPLDAPLKPNNNAKAWDTRGRTLPQLEAEYGLARSTIKYRLSRGIPLDAPLTTRAEARKRAEAARLAKVKAGTHRHRKYRTDPDRLERPLQPRITAGAPVNPFACMAR